LLSRRVENLFATPNDAKIAYNSLRVDPEPKRSQVIKELHVEGSSFIL